MFVKKKVVKDLKEGELVEDVFVVKVKRSVVPYRNGYSFTLILSDSSGVSVEYKFWGGLDEENVKSILKDVMQDSVVLVKGRVSKYNGKLQISSDESAPLKVLKPEEYEASFIEETEKDVNAMFEELKQKIVSVQDEHLKKLLEEVFGELGESFKKHPGAIQIHHAYIGGLVQHTLEVVRHVEVAADLHPGLNKDLLITAGLLHDVGKLDEITMTSRIRGTRPGQLIGHLALGLMLLSDRLKGSEMPELLKDKLLHMLVSHHGRLEYGSPKEPMIPEAVALYYADELSSKIEEMLSFVKYNQETTEDEFAYHTRKGMNILLK